MSHLLSNWIHAALFSMAIAWLLTSVLAIKSLLNFSQTGPKIRQEILNGYSLFASLAFLRLCLWSFVIVTWLSLLGNQVYLSWLLPLEQTSSVAATVAAALAGIAVVSGIQLCRHLLYIPSSLMISSQYSMQRLLPLWKLLSITRLRWLMVAVASLYLFSAGLALEHLWLQERAAEAWLFGAFALALIAPILWAFWTPPRRPSAAKSTNTAPNILMIGCDTLRADRLGLAGYPKPLTPFIDALCNKKGRLFSNCYTPIARTAPSLTSILTGTWPTTHGIRTNFVEQHAGEGLPVSIAKVCANAGYHTAAISDWSGSDLGKFDYGFQELDVAPDQWNIKYLIRQGPKHLRLFLTLFTHNRFGKAFLPELYYLAGIPLTAHLGEATRRYISRKAGDGQPFLLNLFMGTTHPPFGSEYPYYSRYTDPAYMGASKFAMAKLSDPEEIIQSQKEPKSAFDLDQIIDLYDGSVHCFDDEVRKIVQHLQRCKLDQNTLIVIYSDHGMEFFEQNTWGQGNNIFGAASAKIPLVIVDPRHPVHGKEESLCRTIDIMPTLLDLCGLEVPDTVQGTSLAPLLRTDQKITLPGYFETGLWLATPPGQHPGHIGYPELIDLLEIPDKTKGTLAIQKDYQAVIEQARDRLVKEANWLLVRIALQDGPDYQLYDTNTDPHCRHNIAAQYPQIVERLKGVMAEIVEGVVEQKVGAESVILNNIASFTIE